MKPPPKVALLVETSNAYARELLHGVRAWLREHGPWTLWLAEAGRGADPPPWVRDWRGDGIIARIETPAVARAVAATGLPAVDVSAARLLPDVPWLETDDRAIAQMAAEHLRERGFRNFGYCGDSRFNWSRWRGDAFALHLARHGLDCAVFREPRPASGGGSRADWETELSALGRWIRALPKPVGIFAGYDIRGLQVLEASRRAALAVPDTVAVLGVDNDELLCDLADPPLSSVIPDVRRTGYEAAALLDRLMRGGPRSGDGRLFAPLGVATRQSTDVVAVADRHLSTAVRFIREHACDGISVGDVLKQVPVSRRVLEARFQKMLGRSPHAQILSVRLDRVKRLLSETDLPLAAIADRTGFRHVEYLSVAFKRQTGMTASDYRAGRRPSVHSPAPGRGGTATPSGPG
ncbi:MAG: DNA-binding transcriptional regulator [Verrucomicrobiales bacterium]|nr:DNA-binding transcriptional regulator [Verrucomicrobiales bacterium]